MGVYPTNRSYWETSRSHAPKRGKGEFGDWPWGSRGAEGHCGPPHRPRPVPQASPEDQLCPPARLGALRDSEHGLGGGRQEDPGQAAGPGCEPSSCDPQTLWEVQPGGVGLRLWVTIFPARTKREASAEPCTSAFCGSEPAS